MPLLCPHGALGRHLAHRYTINAIDFPDPADPSAWQFEALWPGNDRTQNISYDQQRRAVAQHLAAAGITVDKVTHVFRISGARWLDEAGIDEKVRRH